MLTLLTMTVTQKDSNPARLTAPFILRRTKEQVAKTCPTKQVHIVV
jgi:SNF2 family DNA or RNA helicase